jgi:hypothetical protein
MIFIYCIYICWCALLEARLYSFDRRAMACELRVTVSPACILPRPFMPHICSELRLGPKTRCETPSKSIQVIDSSPCLGLSRRQPSGLHRWRCSVKPHGPPQRCVESYSSPSHRPPQWAVRSFRSSHGSKPPNYSKWAQWILCYHEANPRGKPRDQWTSFYWVVCTLLNCHSDII